MADDCYYLRRRGRVSGPHTMPELRQMADSRQLARFDDLSSDQKDWFSAGESIQLFPSVPATNSSAASSVGAYAQALIASREAEHAPDDIGHDVPVCVDAPGVLEAIPAIPLETGISAASSCPSCGQPIAAKTTFCSDCGFDLRSGLSTRALQGFPDSGLGGMGDPRLPPSATPVVETSLLSTHGRLDRAPYFWRMLMLVFLNGLIVFGIAISYALVAGASMFVIMDIALGLGVRGLESLGLGAMVAGGGTVVLTAAGVVMIGLCLLVTLFLKGIGAIQGVKRLHDLDRSGWQYLLLFIPLYGFYLGLLMLFHKGTQGTNRFGADPLAS